MSKHTPGPWQTLNTAHIFTGLGAARADGTPAPSDDGWMIADCDMGGLPLGEVAANARLIAAAPELLEVARLVIEAGKNRSDRDWEAMHFDISEALEIALPAYTKATGEQP